MSFSVRRMDESVYAWKDGRPKSTHCVWRLVGVRGVAVQLMWTVAGTYVGTAGVCGT
jgi:hypothetical protein